MYKHLGCQLKVTRLHIVDFAKLWRNSKVQLSWSTRYSDRLHDFSVTIPRC